LAIGISVLAYSKYQLHAIADEVNARVVKYQKENSKNVPAGFTIDIPRDFYDTDKTSVGGYGVGMTLDDLQIHKEHNTFNFKVGLAICLFSGAVWIAFYALAWIIRGFASA